MVGKGERRRRRSKALRRAVVGREGGVPSSRGVAANKSSVCGAERRSAKGCTSWHICERKCERSVSVYFTTLISMGHRHFGSESVRKSLAIKLHGKSLGRAIVYNTCAQDDRSGKSNVDGDHTACSFVLEIISLRQNFK